MRRRARCGAAAVSALILLLGLSLGLGRTALADQPAQLVSDDPVEPVSEESSWPDPNELVRPVMGEGDKPALDVKSPSAILMEVLSGRALYEQHADDRREPASLTKIMTMLLAVEAIEEGRLKLTDRLVASENAESYGGTEIWLEPGEEMSIEDILLSIAVASANDASVALAEHMLGSEQEFVDRMNERAKELGMANTNFVNSHGLDDENHYSSARDMAILSCEASRHPDLLHYTAIYEMRIRGGETWLVNRNQMVNYYQGCDGLKTGWTGKAGYSVAVTAKRGGTRFVAVVMGAADPTGRFADCVKMLNWGFATYTSLAVAEKGHSYGAIPIDLGTYREVEAVAPEDHGVLLKKGEEGEVTREVTLVRVLKAPIRRGDPVGAIVVSRNGTELGRCTLVSDRDVGRLSFPGLWWRLFTRLLGAE